MDPKPSKFWAYMAVLVGLLLLLPGFAALIGYFGLPVFLPIEEMLSYKLGQMGTIYVGLFCGPFAIYHGMRAINRQSSTPLKLPDFYVFWIALALVFGLGSLIINFDIAVDYLFPPLFMLGAALSVLAVLAWAYRRMGNPISWRQAALAFFCGSTLSVVVAILLEITLPYLAYLLLEPAWYLAGEIADIGWGTPGLIERLFASPVIIVFLIAIAVQAPIPEEFAKALGIPMFGRLRITNERQAFAIGLASGAGFAILENMVYEGLYANYNGWGWAGVTLLRSIGAVLHPIGTGIIALGWFRMREGGSGKLFKAYLLSIGLHTLWNGGFEPLLYLTGLDYFAGEESSLSFYGETLSTLLVGYLILLSVGIWWLLRRIVNQISERIIPDAAPASVSRRAIATWAVACALVIIPVGATLSPAWNAIRALFVNSEIRQVEMPKFGTAQEAKTAQDRSAVDLRDLSRTHPDPSGINRPGDVYQYEINLEKSSPVIWSYGWCATSQWMLDQNFKQMKLEFLVGETVIPMDTFHVRGYRSNNLLCRQYRAVIESWPRGCFELETRVTFLKDINDGIEVYPAGTHYFRYRVTVKR